MLGPTGPNVIRRDKWPGHCTGTMRGGGATELGLWEETERWNWVLSERWDTEAGSVRRDGTAVLGALKDTGQGNWENGKRRENK